MENPIVENVLPKGWETELKKLDKVLIGLAEQAEKINIGLSGGAKGSGKGNTVAPKIDTAPYKELVRIMKEYKEGQEKLLKIEAQILEAKRRRTEASTKLTREEKLQLQVINSAVGSYKQISAQYSLNVIEIDKMSKAQRRQAEEERKLISTTKELKEEMRKLKHEQADDTPNVGNYASAWAGANGVLGKFGAVSAVAGGNIVALGKKFLPFAGIAAVVYGIGRAFSSAYREIKEFDQAMANVNAITGASKSELNELKNLAISLGGSTKFTATEIAGLETELGKLGYTTNQIIAATEGIVLAAAATGEGLGRTAEIVGSTTMAFGLAASESQRVADVMAMTFNKTASGLDDFAESIKYIAPVAKQAGVSVEETAALIGVLANSGIKGSMAGTSLRNIFTELIGTGGNLQDRIKELAKNGLNLASAEDEVGKRAQTSLLILKDAIDTIPDLTVALENAGGAAQEMADKQLDSLTGATKLMTSAWNGFVLSIDNGTGKFSTAIKSMIIDATNIIQGFRKFLQSDQERALESTSTITEARIKSLKAILPTQKDQIKYMSEEIEAERNLYKQKKERIAQIESIISSNNNAGGAWKKNNKALQEESAGLKVAVNRSIEYINATAGLRESRRQEAEMADKTATIVKKNQKVGEEELATVYGKADAYSKLEKQLEPLINQAKKYAETETVSFKDRQQSVVAWYNLRVQADDDIYKKEAENHEKAYQKEKQKKKKRSDLEEWHKSEIERIQLEASNSQISIMDDAEKMIEAINAEEVKSEQEKAKAIKAIQDDTLKHRLSKFDELIAAANKAVKDELQLEDDKEKLRVEIIQQSVDTIASIGDALFERRANQLDEEQQKNEEAYNDRIEAIDAMGLSEEQATQEKAAAEDYYRSQLAETDRKEKELKRDQFLFDQAMALAQVVIATAVNVATFPLLSEFYIALGALQAAAIAAATIPQFAEGGKIPHVSDGRITESSNVPRRSNGDSLLAYLTPKTETVITNDQMLALGGAWAMKMAGVPGYEDARYQPDMSDIRTGYTGKNGNIIVNANFESEKIVRKLDELIKVSSKNDSPKLMDTLKSYRHGNR